MYIGAFSAFSAFAYGDKATLTPPSRDRTGDLLLQTCSVPIADRAFGLPAAVRHLLSARLVSQQIRLLDRCKASVPSSSRSSTREAPM